ncbi:hypothetical protein FRACA_120020 [Frankia canadensis]|uniref:Uncharacterized protein n=1 Tax=Frankia canadensis TaxID=1836972 RepID=A0A2I2KJY7_9ACTN|nr:hypothetical protein FRACA_120020 [Frankia canadensis]SOU53247.1 hypothetical protein FRACA_120020 [Frankia canadensis]
MVVLLALLVAVPVARLVPSRQHGPAGRDCPRCRGRGTTAASAAFRSPSPGGRRQA